METIINISSSCCIKAAGGQWIGMRSQQTDSIYLPHTPRESQDSLFLAILADGMGDGDKAGKAITEHFHRAFETESRGNLMAALKAANSALAVEKKEGNITSEAGATLLAMSIDHRQLRWLSVGDSLLYRQRGSDITKLNNAHTWQWEPERRVQSGEMTQEQADAAPGPRQALYAAVRGDDIAAADISNGAPYCEGDRFILASDGLLPVVEAGWETILNAPENREAPPAKVRDLLLDATKAMQRPTQDNTSVIIIDICPRQQETQPETTIVIENPKAPFILGKAQNASVVSLLGNRSEQQDAAGCWQSDQAMLAVVADGAGGHTGGAIAAQMAIKSMERLWQHALADGVEAKHAAALLTEHLEQTHRNIISHFGGKASLSGKCAIVALYRSGTEYVCINAGDCRAYVSDKKQWNQLSTDDSILRLLIESGEISPEEALHHPDQNILTQALGSSGKMKPHVHIGTYTDSRAFLLCCDGLWNQLPPAFMEMAAWEQTPNNDYAERLMTMAQAAVDAAAGKSDNVTAIWVHPKTTPSVTTGRQVHNIAILLSVVAVLFLAIAAGLIITPPTQTPPPTQAPKAAPPEPTPALQGQDENTPPETGNSPTKQEKATKNQVIYEFLQQDGARRSAELAPQHPRR